MRTYEGDCDSNVSYLYESIVDRAIKGKRGQKLLKELEAALIALPEKKLIHFYFSKDGQVCSLGALALKREMESGKNREEALELINDKFDKKEQENECFNMPSHAAKEFGIAKTLAHEIMYENDEGHYNVTPEERYGRVLNWVRSKIK
jgi:hypothetical protein